MRKFAKISAVLAAMVLALAFVGCKDDDDDNDQSVVTTWCTESNSSKFYFYDDGSVKFELDVETYSGSYSGDTTKDGTIKVFATVEGSSHTFTLEITDGKLYFEGYEYIKK
ncbi:MAG: hypothetical protein SOV76_11490 [Treponema succinifaciens]|uniref:hypothetical protein n=1 Tax=Treponema succinifaciens TaxID=167 RepID=UPI002A7514DB|nr:hypothetical protein [Treponema succinifaciens]MDY2617158.1 hypothetical protein [Treponema succinifaciens]